MTSENDEIIKQLALNILRADTTDIEELRLLQHDALQLASQIIDDAGFPATQGMTKLPAACLCCEKPLAFNDCNAIDGGGKMSLVFGYGSTHDGLRTLASKNRRDKLLMADIIEAYICDDCFDKKSRLMNGYRTKETRVKIPIT